MSTFPKRRSSARVVENRPRHEVYPFINTIALFRGQWGVQEGIDVADGV
jgi:hypothetical protein